MKFPGRRKSKHYFPVAKREEHSLDESFRADDRVFLVGIDQLIVDIEIYLDSQDLELWDIAKGQSCLAPDEKVEQIYQYYREKNKIRTECPGGTIGNTLHNFSTLSDTQSALLGCINKNISVGDYSFKYLCATSSKINLSYLQSSEKPIARALCLITEDGERSFLISKGCMNDLEKDHIDEDLIQKSSCLVFSAYPLRDLESPIMKSTLRACEFAKKHNTPVALTLGTSQLVEDKREEILNILGSYVNIVAMNLEEGKALTGLEDPLIICDTLLDQYVDMVLLTDGERGIYLGAYVDEEHARKTRDSLHTKSIVNYNEFEYSRGMLVKDCQNPIKVYTHINPFMGGPKKIKNTNGAGDGALAALLHDIAANNYHRNRIPHSPKHGASYLTYSSISQISKYANRVSFEVLLQDSPRLSRGLPQQEESLENDAYWER